MRNNTIDAGKLLGCFFIIFVHVGLFREYPSPYGEYIRIYSRWAVPFFFIASGYVISDLSKNEIFKRIIHLSKISLISSLLYTPVSIYNSKLDIIQAINNTLSSISIANGTYGHLWFINSMIAGYILIYIFKSHLNKKINLIISISLLLSLYIYNTFIHQSMDREGISVLQFLMSYPLIYLGFISKKIKKPKTARIVYSILFITLSLGMLFESFMENNIFSVNLYAIQFPILCFPAALSLTLLLSSFEMDKNIFSDLGKKHSLNIYLIHPFIIYILRKETQNSTILVILSFLISLLTSLIIHYFKREKASG